MNPRRLFRIVFAIIAISFGESRAAQWTNVLNNSDSIPIGVWLQDPHNAERFKNAGINLYVGLWKGPSTEQLARLKSAGMPVICSQSQEGLAHKENPLIVAWMHNDEPDNAQSLGKGKGYGPPILPRKIVDDYQAMRATDPTRPILLNLGQGVAWDDYIGRGTRRNHPEDYGEYVKGCDIVSFDIYPAVHEDKEVAGKLEYVSKGVERLVKWSEDTKQVWNCIECTHIHGKGDGKASPEQIRAEVWMSLIHGSRGLIYFVHQFEPNFREAALLDDPVTLGAVTEINRRVQAMAKVLKSAPPVDQVSVKTDGAPIDFITRRDSENLYIFAVCMRNERTQAVFTKAKQPATSWIEVLDENRHVSWSDDHFSDEFKPYAVHLYKAKIGEF
ncbi:MAG: putative glycosyl hydrolase [Verrucomicrobiales bacterium]|nr:putative glycosyl hydrolase [Verrucomicrobiales bacterium]